VRFLGWLSESVLGRRVEVALAWGSIDRPGALGNGLARWFARLQTGELQAYVVYALVGLAAVLAWGGAHA
jgi:hypothetical protein